MTIIFNHWLIVLVVGATPWRDEGHQISTYGESVQKVLRQDQGG